MGKGEIAHNKQFLPFPYGFQKTCTADTYKHGLVWERVKGGPNRSKVSADDRWNVAKNVISAFIQVENIVRKE